MPQLAVGNWKMHTTRDEAVRLVRGLVELTQGIDPARAIVGVAPPYPFLDAVRDAIGGAGVELVAQDCHEAKSGAFTGAVSAPMLASVGVKRVIVGHSERRQVFGDSDETVRAKLLAVLDAGLHAILCVGETLPERDAGQAEAVVERQLRAGLADLDAAALARVTIAYEPVWAIGTGRTATPAQAGELHAFVRERVLPQLQAGSLAVLYGGSVKPDNIDALAATPHVGGVLVGGASLEASSFARIVRGCADHGAE
ncbi:MAG: triose-phosphate isomerase [Planctomycetota bacterium]